VHETIAAICCPGDPKSCQLERLCANLVFVLSHLPVVCAVWLRCSGSRGHSSAVLSSNGPDAQDASSLLPTCTAVRAARACPVPSRSRYAVQFPRVTSAVCAAPAAAWTLLLMSGRSLTTCCDVSGAAYGAVVQPVYAYSPAAAQQQQYPQQPQWAAQPLPQQQPLAAVLSNNPYSVLMRQPASQDQGAGGRMRRDPRSR